MTIIGVPGAIPDSALVWNLLFYDTVQQSQTDSQLQNTTGIVTQPVTVIQFGTPSAGTWIMVTCPQSDPTSFSARLALQFFPGIKSLNFVNSTFIQDLENLTVTGFFSNGLPLP